MSFDEKIQRTGDSAAKGFASLGKLMVNVGGPRFSTRRPLITSENSVLLYGAEFWAQALNKRCFRNQESASLLFILFPGLL